MKLNQTNHRPRPNANKELNDVMHY